MIAYIKAGFISLSCFVILVGCQQDSPREEQVRNLSQGTGTQIIAFGDSITAGAGVDSNEAYPSVLSDILNLPILNRGRGGDTTGSALQRIEDVIAEDPWLVMVGLGGNDYLRQVPLEETRENLRSIVLRFQEEGAIVVVLAINVHPFNGDYEQIYHQVAHETQAYLIPQVLEGLNEPRYLYDDIHPNSVGHEMIAHRIADGLQPLLDEANIPPNLSSPTSHP